MDHIREAGPVKLFVGMISGDPPLFEEAQRRLEAVYGPVEEESPIFPWRHSSYYEEEMGAGLKRKFIFFERMVAPGLLVPAKRRTYAMERDFMIDGKRRINLDPGYVDLPKLVLASTKDFSHRIYMGDGIYGEVTLYVQDGSFRPLPYTFPDFRGRDYIDLFNGVRERLLRKGNGG